MKRFEYCYVDSVIRGKPTYRMAVKFSSDDRTIFTDKTLTYILGELGEDGWEMVGCVTTGPEEYMIYFKREI
jgi:hypothetical protein